MDGVGQYVGHVDALGRAIVEDPVSRLHLPRRCEQVAARHLARFIQDEFLQNRVAAIGHIQVTMLININPVGTHRDLLADGLERGDQMRVPTTRSDLHVPRVEAEPVDTAHLRSVVGLAHRRVGDVDVSAVNGDAIGHVQSVCHDLDRTRFAASDAHAQQPRVVGHFVQHLAVRHVEVA